MHKTLLARSNFCSHAGRRALYRCATRTRTGANREWPDGEREPIKYWLSTLPFRQLFDITKLRWRIGRDYQELKQEVGLGHFEGREWRGFHHHATLCIAAYGFLISERDDSPLNRSCHRGVLAVCLTRRLPAHRIRPGRGAIRVGQDHRRIGAANAAWCEDAGL
jgi:SRSO17 transposase